MRTVSLKSAELAPLSAEVLARGGALRFEAHGGSMAPFIRPGDVLTVEPTAADGLRVGDVALYRRGANDLVVHRVVARRIEGGQIWLTMRGDAAPGAAEQVAGSQVLGRIVHLQRAARVIRLDRNNHRLLAWLWNGFAFRHLCLTVFEQNSAAIHLYRKMGFRLSSIPGLDEQLAEEARQGVPRRIIMSGS